MRYFDIRKRQKKDPNWTSHTEKKKKDAEVKYLKNGIRNILDTKIK